MREGRQRRSRGLIVELVGPGGTGKSSVAALLSQEWGYEVMSVLHRRGVLPRIRALLTALILAERYRLDARELLDLFRRCSSVEQGLALLREVSAHPVILDEGPLRTLRDARLCSYRARRAWWAYARKVLARIGSTEQDGLVIHLALDETVRLARYAARTRGARAGPLTSRAPQGTASTARAPKIPTIRFGMRVAMRRTLGDLFPEARLAIDRSENPHEIAARVAALIRERACAHALST